MTASAPTVPSSRRSPLAAARSSRAAWRRLSPFFARSRGLILLVALVSVLSGLAEASLLAVIAAIAMTLAEGKEIVEVEFVGVALSAMLAPTMIAALLLATVRGALHLWVAYLPAKMSGQAMVDIRQRLFDAFVNAAWPVKAQEREGGFQAVMINQVRATAEAIILVSVTISSLFMFLTLVLSALAMSATSAAVIAVVSLLLFAGLRPLSRALRRNSKKLSAENIEYAKVTQEVATLAEEVQVFGATRDYRNRFYEQLSAVQAPFQRVRFLSGAVPSLYQSAALLVLVLALGVVALMGADNLAALGAVVLILVRATTYGQRVQTAITSLDEKIPFINHLADAIERYEAEPQTAGSVHAPNIRALEMTDVEYSYEDQQPVLRDVNFTVQMGEITGIVGPSGAGKSTLVQLLLRLREPTSGKYLVNSTDASSVKLEDWHDLVAYVPQSPRLIYGTIHENIRFFRDDVTDEAIIMAARRAQIHDEVLDLPDGYETVVGARASTVSGGQRQRICLARALVANPAVLILDEPTSALDVKSEGLVQDSLRDLAGGAIVFLVAHRLSTLSICDRVMVIGDGTVQAFDTAQQLLTNNSYFREVSLLSSSEHATVTPAGGVRGRP